jgi:hypothetical protein
MLKRTSTYKRAQFTARPSQQSGNSTRKAQAGPGRSAGFITTRKKLSKYKKTRQAKISRKGVVIHVQSGQIVTMATGGNRQAIALGHATCPQQLMLVAGWIAVWKLFIQRLGISILGLDDAIPFITGDVMQIRYRRNLDEDAALQNISLTATSTIQSLAELCVNNAIAWNFAANLTPDGTEFDYIRFIPTATQVNLNGYRMHFATVKIAFDIQTHMKVQNRTVLGLDTSIEAVDNVPLYGKTYEGKGTGPKYLQMEGVTKKNNYVADAYYGNIIPRINSTGADPSMVEPPDPQMFEGVKTFGNVKLESGEIKTSALTFKRNYSWHTFYKMFYSQVDAGDKTIFSPVYRSAGKFRLFAIQKMIDAEQSTITLALENELKICVNAAGGAFTPSVGKTMFLTYTPPQPPV